MNGGTDAGSVGILLERNELFSLPLANETYGSHGRKNFTHYQGTVRSIIMAEADLSPGMNGKSANPSRFGQVMVFIRKMSVRKASVKALLGLTQLGQLRCELGYTLLEDTSSMRQPVWAVRMGGIAIALAVTGLQGKLYILAITVRVGVSLCHG